MIRDLQRNHRNAVLVGSLLLLLVILASMSWNYGVASEQQWRSAHADLAELNKLSAQIDRLQNVPRIASLELESPDEISRRVSSAMQQLAGTPAVLQQVDPQVPLRLGKSDYQLRATELAIEEIQVEELATFINALVADGQGLQVRDIVLTQPKTASKSERWLARLTLTQLIFSPTSR